MASIWMMPWHLNQHLTNTWKDSVAKRPPAMQGNTPSTTRSESDTRLVDSSASASGITSMLEEMKAMNEAITALR